MSTTTASPPADTSPTHTIEIDVTRPTPEFQKIPEMTVGDKVEFKSGKPVTITFPGLSPFSNERTNTSIPDGVILVVVRHSDDQPKKAFMAQCRLDEQTTPKTAKPGSEDNSGWGAEIPVRKPGSK
jgi:hypothetical protein